MKPIKINFILLFFQLASVHLFGQFNAPIEIASRPILFRNCFTLGDIDGDQLQDVLAWGGSNGFSATDLNWGNEKLNWYKNLGNGYFDLAINLSQELYTCSHAILLDAEQNGTLDIVYTVVDYSYDPFNVFIHSHLKILRNLGGGNFGPPEFLLENCLGNIVFTKKDMNQDGFEEILFLSNFSTTSDTFNIGDYFLNESGVFVNHISTPLSSENIRLSVMPDFNNNGNSDYCLYYSHVGYDSLVFINHIQNSEIGIPSINLSTIETFNINFNDVNEDGFIDILTHTQFELIIHLNNNNENWSEAQTLQYFPNNVLIDILPVKDSLANTRLFLLFQDSLMFAVLNQDLTLQIIDTANVEWGFRPQGGYSSQIFVESIFGTDSNVLFFNAMDKIGYYFVNNNGFANEQFTVSGDGILHWPYSNEIIDYDKDGFLDILIHKGWYKNLGNNTFSKKQLESVFSFQHRPHIGYVNNDEFYDFVSRDAGNSIEININKGLAQNTFSEIETFTIFNDNDNDNLFHFELIDLNTDGDDELVVIRNILDSSFVTVFDFNNQTNNFDRIQDFSFYFNFVIYYHTHLKDVNNDGHEDILLLSKNNETDSTTIEVLYNNGNNTLTHSSILEGNFDNFSLLRLNDDDQLDIVTCKTYQFSEGSIIKLYLNNGSGNYLIDSTFMTPKEVEINCLPKPLDSRDNLILTSLWNPKLRVMDYNYGNLEFTVIDSTVGCYKQSFCFDFDGDLDYDLLVPGWKDLRTTFYDGIKTTPAIIKEEYSLNIESDEKIYPNPVEKIVLSNFAWEQCQVFNLIDAKPLLVYSNNEILNLENLTNGIYFMKFVTKSKSLTFKILKL